MIGVIGDDNGRVILQLGILRCSVSAIEFTLGAKMTIVDWISKNVEWLFSGIAITVPLAVLGWFANRRKKRNAGEATPAIVHSVTSHNQSGGITAHTVNVQEVRRSLSSGNAGAPQLARFPATSAFFHRYSELPEVGSFSANILQMLRNSGWNAIESASHIGDSSIVNVVIQVNAALEADDQSIDAAAALEKLLAGEGIAVQPTRLAHNPLPKNSIYIRVGPVA
jgi:hypothetical protein